MIDQDDKATGFVNVLRFTRTGVLWLVLVGSVLAWLALSAWAYKISVFGSADIPALSLETPAESNSQDAQQAADTQAAEEEHLAAQARAAKAAQQAAEAQAAENARRLAEAQAAEEARLAAEAQAAEEERLAAEARAAEEAQQAAEARAAEDERLAAEAQAAEEARLATEALAAETIDVATADQLTAPASSLSAYEQRLRDEISVLPGLSTRVRFEGRSELVTRQVERELDPIFDPLFLNSDLPILVSVATHEFRFEADNDRISRSRGRAIVAYLVGRGLEVERFRVVTTPGEGLPYGSHRVTVSVEDPVQ